MTTQAQIQIIESLERRCAAGKGKPGYQRLLQRLYEARHEVLKRA